MKTMMESIAQDTLHLHACLNQSATKEETQLVSILSRKDVHLLWDVISSCIISVSQALEYLQARDLLETEDIEIKHVVDADPDIYIPTLTALKKG